jgi:3-oxoacyl-[acyl-carrier protein] reductase
MIIVTGASKGLGLNICQRLLSNNYEVLGLSRNINNVEFSAISCDVSSYQEIKEVAKKLKKDKTKVTGLINAAGIASMNLALTTPEKLTREIVNTNLLGTIFCSQQFAPLMLRNKEGTIINFSTIAVFLGLKGESIYAASKAGVEGFTKAFAREMADFNIQVNCIAPGPIDTSLLKGVTPEQINKIVSQQIINKQFTPESVSDLVEILIDKKSDSISGQILRIGGA